MINLSVNKNDRILGVEMSGMISEADIDAAADSLASQFPGVNVHIRGGENGGFNMLIDWEKLDGWEMGAKTLGTMTTKAIGDAVRKVAVIAEDRFSDEKERIADIAPQAAVQFFPPAQRETALAWLRNR